MSIGVNNHARRTCFRNSTACISFMCDAQMSFIFARVAITAGLLVVFSALCWSQGVLQALPPDTPETCHARSQIMEKWLEDWPNLAWYQVANRELLPTEAAGIRVVFMGDSITYFWDLDKYFPGQRYVNRGIGGQTTPQMLLRFRQDVVALKPTAVVILAGTNDIGGNTGPLSLEEIEDNFRSMAEIAAANNIAVVFSSVLPVNNYTESSQRFYAERPAYKILSLNDWLKSYTLSHHDTYLDYYSHMLDGKGMLAGTLADDGLHPNANGYRVMADLAQKAIAQVVSIRRGLEQPYNSAH